MTTTSQPNVETGFSVPEIVDGLRRAGAYPVTMYGGDYCTVNPGKVRPLGYQISEGHSVRQRLLSVVRPPEYQGLIGIVAGEVHDRFLNKRHVGLFVSRLAVGGHPAELRALVQPGEIVETIPDESDGSISWYTGVTLGPKDNVVVMHAGKGKTDVYAVPDEMDRHMLLPYADLWAPKNYEVFAAFTGKA